jgi:TRAP-type uncharacterized transport system substrate-binding protein
VLYRIIHAINESFALAVFWLYVAAMILGKLKEAHANNDKISAVRIGKAFLAGTARNVWVPDLKSQEHGSPIPFHPGAKKYLEELGIKVK